MTSLEPPLPVPDDDALDAAASALVDGVATPEEAALVAASPDGAARLAALRAVSEAVGRPGPQQSPAAAASALAAALAAFDAAGADATTAAGTPAPRLGSDGESPADPDATGDEAGDAKAIEAEEGQGNVRALRPRVGSPSSARWQPRLGAVAAALVLLIGVAVLTVNLLGRAGNSEAPTDMAAAPSSPAAGRPGDTAASAAARAEASARAEAAAVIDGGDFGNESAVEAIALRAAAAFDSPPVPATADATSLPGDLQRCLEADPSTVTEEVGAPLYQAEGTFRGIPALAIAYQRDGDPPRLLLVLARSDCSLLERTSF